MSSRGQALQKLSLLNSNQKKTSVETPEPVGGVKENYLSKCKRYLKSLPSNTVIVDTPAARGSKKVSKKKLNFVAQNADDEVIENEDPKEVPDFELVEGTEAGPSQGNTTSGLCLLWKTGQIDSPSKASDADEEIDESEKSPESEAPVNVETIESSDEQPSPRKEAPTAVEKSAANVDETIAEEPSANVLNDSEPVSGDVGIESDVNVPVPKKGLNKKKKNEKDKASKAIDKAEKTKRAVEQSVKSGFLTLKKNLRMLQMKNGLEADFLLIMKNNYQKKQKKNSAVTAEKYLTFGAGNLKEMFSSGSGVVYNPEKFVLLDSSDNMDVDQEETIKAIQNIGRTTESQKKKNVKTSSVPPPPPAILVSESESNSEEENEDSSESSDSDVSSDLDIFNMRTQAVRVDTPGTSQDNLRDSGTLVYGSGAKKTSPELQKQREKRKKETVEASKKVQSDVLGVVGGKTKAKVVRKGGGKKGGKKGGQKGGQKKSVRL